MVLNQHLSIGNKPAIMELGNEGVTIVKKDADLNLVTAKCAREAFLFSGQIYISNEKILIHQDLYEDFR